MSMRAGDLGRVDLAEGAVRGAAAGVERGLDPARLHYIMLCYIYICIYIYIYIYTRRGR